MKIDEEKNQRIQEFAEDFSAIIDPVSVIALFTGKNNESVFLKMRPDESLPGCGLILEVEDGQFFLTGTWISQQMQFARTRNLFSHDSMDALEHFLTKIKPQASDADVTVAKIAFLDVISTLLLTEEADRVLSTSAPLPAVLEDKILRAQYCKDYGQAQPVTQDNTCDVRATEEKTVAASLRISDTHDELNASSLYFPQGQTIKLTEEMFNEGACIIGNDRAFVDGDDVWVAWGHVDKQEALDDFLAGGWQGSDWYTGQYHQEIIDSMRYTWAVAEVHHPEIDDWSIRVDVYSDEPGAFPVTVVVR